MMDIRALRYFVEVVDQQSFTKAAAQLHLTQPTVSKMVQQLESSLGLTLLDRVGKSFTLTDAGLIVLKRAKEMIALHDDMNTELKDLQQVELGALRMGLSPSTHVALAPVFAAYHARYPKIELKLFEIGGSTTIQDLRQGTLEFGTILESPRVADIWEEFDSMLLFESPMCLLAPYDSPWKSRRAVDLCELRHSEFIFYGDTFTLNQFVLDACAQAGFEPRISGRSGQWDFIASLVRLGVGITLLPMAFCETLDPSQFTIVPIKSPSLNWRLMLAWRRHGKLSFAAQAWLTLAKELMTAPPGASR